MGHGSKLTAAPVTHHWRTESGRKYPGIKLVPVVSRAKKRGGQCRIILTFRGHPDRKKLTSKRHSCIDPQLHKKPECSADWEVVLNNINRGHIEWPLFMLLKFRIYLFGRLWFRNVDKHPE